MPAITARWPFKIGDTLIPAGEQGRTATLEEAGRVFAGIRANPDSPFVSVIFRNLSPCVVLKKQVQVVKADE